MYETNVASCRIWDALGFKRIGRVKGCGNLRSYPGELVDAIIYGRDLGQDDDFVSEERFDKIRFYLKNGKYPNGADRAEKSRLRSAATHYKLIPAQGEEGEKLMLKGKEVISDAQRQYEIARQVHHKSHGGINKTTAAIAESYHWVRIKETVSQVIRNCPECSEMNKGLANNRSSFGTQRFPQQPPSTTAPPRPQPTPGRQQRFRAHVTREESPGAQLQLEAAQAHTFPEHGRYPSNFDMPLDPALMGDGNGPANLEDLPPSPFLAAGRGLQPVPQVSNLDLPVPDLPPPVARMPSGDSEMSGMGERAPTVREEIRRRLTRAGQVQR